MTNSLLRLTWLSVYIYNQELTLEYVLENFIPKYLASIKTDDSPFKFFFVRYIDQDGSHIRFRILINNDYHQVLMADIRSKYESFYTQSTGRHLNQILTGTLLFKATEYEPETERYGGLDALKTAEEYFHLSSSFILSMYAEYDMASYSNKLELALRLHTSLLKVSELSIETSKKLLTNIISSWIPAILHQVSLPSNLSWKEKEDYFFNLFSVSYLENETSIDETIRSVWSGDWREDHYFTNWVKEIQKIAEDLKYYLKQSSNEEKEETIQKKFVKIIATYIHMTNNKIGIQNSDESYIAYLILKGLDKCR